MEATLPELLTGESTHAPAKLTKNNIIIIIIN
jgi:hypothetical protein